MIGTFAAFAGTLAAYKFFNIQVGSKFRTFVIAAMFGMVALGLLEMVLGFFGNAIGFFGFGSLGLLFAVAGLVLGVFMLILDFDFVEHGIAAGLPERESWRAAFGLTVSLVWIYTNLLRILAILARRLTGSLGSRRRDLSGRVPRLDQRCSSVAPRRPASLGRVVWLDPGASTSARGRRRRCRSSTQRPRRPRSAPATSVPSSSVPGVRRPRPPPSRSAGRPRRGRPAAAASSSGTSAERGEHRRQQHGDQRAVAVGGGVEPVRPEEAGRGRRRTPGPRIEPSETVRPPASTTAIVCAAASRRDHERATCSQRRRRSA